MHKQSTAFQDRKRVPLEWDYEDYLDHEYCTQCGEGWPEGECKLVRGHLVCPDCLDQAKIDARRARHE